MKKGTTKLIIGLGNPGPEYEDTRHNIGFLVVDTLADRLGTSITNRHSKAFVGKGKFEDHLLILAKPQTYMNLSGNSVEKLVDRFEITAKDIIVVHDDLDLEFGRIQIKRRGGAGGHKGLISTIETLQTDVFTRLRIGISRPKKETVDYVLAPFSRQEKKSLNEIIDQANEAIEYLITKGITAAMNKYNKR